jgi:hypothetical protein
MASGLLIGSEGGTMEAIDVRSAHAADPDALEFDPIHWIDPSMLPAFRFGLCKRGDRSVILGYLDPAWFPTVIEFERALARSKDADPRQTLLSSIQQKAEQVPIEVATP